MVDDIFYLLGLGNSYHICIFFNFVCYLHVTAQKNKVYNLQQADYVKMKELLAEIKWTEVLIPWILIMLGIIFQKNLISYYKIVSPYSLVIQGKIFV